MPLPLMIDYFDGGEYTPGIYEFVIPFVLSFVIFGLLYFRKGTLKQFWLKIGLAIIPVALGLYVGGYVLFKLVF